MALNNKKGIAFAITTATLWGVLAIGIKIVLAQVDAITVVWVRMLTAALGLGVYFLVKERSAYRVFVKPPKLIWLPAIGIALNYIGYAKGIELAGPASAQVVIQMGPIILCLAGFFLFKERFVMRQNIGFVLAFIGLLFFYRKQIQSIDAGQVTFVKGVLATIGGAVAWSTYSISQKAIVKTNPVQHVNLFIFTFAALVYTPFVDFSAFAKYDPWVWWMLLFLGLNTLIAYGSLGEALKYTDAGKISVIIILNPIITFILLELMESWGIDWIPYEDISIWAYIGAVMMLSGAILATASSRKNK